jgi:dUTP pyrophosphatase
MEQNTTNGDENNNVISWTHSPGGGSASWSAGCSNERVSSISKEKTTTRWTSSWSEMGKSLANVQPPYRIVSVKKKKSRPYFVLKIFIDSTENYDLYKKYVGAVKQHNDIVSQYKSGGESSVYFDAGFDLFCPETIVISDSRTGALVHKLNHMVKCSMMKVDVDADGEEFRAPVGYYMYPRSSTGTKTPLRLANSVGIIDSGYRGHIIAAFDAPPSFSCTGGAYTVEAFQRLVQICPPDLSYPVEVELVAEESLLGVGGQRGGGGFGSTGI